MKYAYFSASLGSQVNAKSLETSFTAGAFDETTGSPLASASRTVNQIPHTMSEKIKDLQIYIIILSYYHLNTRFL